MSECCPSPSSTFPPFTGLFQSPLAPITIVAAGTTQLTATPASLAQILVNGGTGGIVLPQAASFANRWVPVFNRAGATITIYPYSGDQIETNGVNVGISLATGHTAIFAVSVSGFLILTTI